MIGHSWQKIEQTVSWKDWNPGLDNGHLTLGEVLATLPASDPTDIPWIVRLFENPNPPIRFPDLFPLPGAISLERHDAIHCLLGRGLMPQDEAFVIGFTMGATKNCMPWHFTFFRFIAKYLYPKHYKFNDEHLLSLDLGYNKGKESLASDLGHFPFERFKDFTLNQLRDRLGISKQKLYAIYRVERMMLPHTKESGRLDYQWMASDPSYIAPKETANA